jgi:LL-diaminopimelate aminotransferase
LKRPSERLSRLPVYAINELAAAKKRLLAAGRDVIDLSAGDADLAPPAIAIETLARAAAEPAMSRYAFQIGLIEFREAAAGYMKRRFGVDVDPMTELLPLIGSKNGLAHLPLAVLDSGDVCVVPEPGYPAYMGAVLADADVVRYPLLPERDFLVELDELTAERLASTGLVFLNYPNNPTTALAPRDYLERTVEICHRHNIVLAYDNPYCEITFDGYEAPSILELEGAREVSLEFFSLSKSFCMTGWRLGWVVGSATLVAALSKVKSYVDTGQFLAIQKAGAAVLNQAEELIVPIRETFEVRRDAGVEAFRNAGLTVDVPKATMYLWIQLPGGGTSADFSQRLLENEAVAVMPGSAFGGAGEGYFRIALTVDRDRLAEAGKRLSRELARSGGAGARA